MEINRLDVGDSAVRELIGDLVRHGVAVTSTLAVLESFTGDQSFDPRVRPMLAPRLRDTYDAAAAGWKDRNAPGNRMFAGTLRTEMAFERAFVAAGGKLLAGVDPTGWGGVLAGFGDQRELELLVEAGFASEQAIEIATSNGARFLAERELGTIAPGMQADLSVVAGDPARNIADVRKIEIVFKDGRAYDPAALLAEADGGVGGFELQQLMTWKWFVVAGILSALIANRLVRARYAHT